MFAVCEVMERLNQALSESDPESLYESLSLPPLGLSDLIMAECKEQYLTALQQVVQEKKTGQ